MGRLYICSGRSILEQYFPILMLTPLASGKKIEHILAWQNEDFDYTTYLLNGMRNKQKMVLTLYASQI